VIRRPASVLLFVLGGLMLMTEGLWAFFDIDPGFKDNLFMIGILSALAAPLLLAGTWISPGERWRELGLTMLMAIAFAAVCVFSVIVVFTDPAAKDMIPADMPPIGFVPAIGIANALILGGVGWLLYRRGRALD
jgi:drug/metabolite transporter (DMT)-like permease